LRDGIELGYKEQKDPELNQIGKKDSRDRSVVCGTRSRDIKAGYQNIGWNHPDVQGSLT
jgi:hypothetical protein